MIINTPAGSWLCNDDFGGLNPMIELVNPGPGQFDVWVGSLSSGGLDPGSLYITELDYTPSNHP